MSLGSRIYEQRTAHKLSQVDLADRLEVSRQSISKWETDASVPELDKLVKMCEVFEVSMDWLTRGREESPAPDQPASALLPIAAPQHVLGFILIALGLFIFVRSAGLCPDDPAGVLLALPFLVCGGLCFVIHSKRLLLGFGWVLWFFFQQLLRSHEIEFWDIPNLLLGYDAFQSSTNAFFAFLAFAGFWALFFLTVRAFIPKEEANFQGTQRRSRKV